MRFLADENVHADLVVWLRTQGHDVAYVAESTSGIADRSVLDLAVQQGRILLTMTRTSASWSSYSAFRRWAFCSSACHHHA